MPRTKCSGKTEPVISVKFKQWVGVKTTVVAFQTFF